MQANFAAVGAITSITAVAPCLPTVVGVLVCAASVVASVLGTLVSTTDVMPARVCLGKYRLKIK